MSFVSTNGLQKTLFKKILISHFPKKLPTQGLQPTSVFVSFIGAKQFFSIVTRKIVENYKLNYFDIALDPFELKIGFGEKSGVKVKNIEDYYAYCSAANMNGNRLYTPGSIGNMLTMFSSSYLHKYFQRKDLHLYMYFITTIYLISYIFFAKIKVFPYSKSHFDKKTKNEKEKNQLEEDRKENFNWFIDIFFEFYMGICSQTKTKLTKTKLNSIKKSVLKEVGLFFALYETYLNANSVFDVYYGGDKDIYTQLLYSEDIGLPQKVIIKNYINKATKYRKLINFNKEERFVINRIIPNDFLTKYVFTTKDALLSSEYIFEEVFDHNIFDKYLMGFVKNGDKLEEFIQKISSYKQIRNSFFIGMEKLLEAKYQNGLDNEDEEFEDETDLITSKIGILDQDEDEEFDNFDEDVEDFMQIPERIQEESSSIERLLNFYITFVGGFCVSRGDSGFMRLFRQDLFKDIINEKNIIGKQKLGLEYFGGLLYIYNKNLVYYKYIHENVKLGKDKFSIPHKTALKKINSNMLLMQSFDQNFISTLLQDINPSDIEIYIQSGIISDFFQKKFSKKISTIVNFDNKKLLNQTYKPLNNLFRKNTNFLKSIQKHFSDNDVRNLKSSLYSLDFWIMQTVYEGLYKYKSKLRKDYGDMSLMGMLATMKDTILGFMLYISYVHEQTIKQTKDKKFADRNIQRILLIYCNTIVGISRKHIDSLSVLLYKIFIEYEKVFSSWHKIDDNLMFFSFGYDNRKIFIKQKKLKDVLNKLSGEDILRFRGYLKNATFYNKRYLIPEYKN